MAKAKNTKGKETSTRQRVSAAAASQPRRKRGSIKEYFKGVRLEMKKVVWPTKEELGSYTAVVLITCAAFAVAFWAIDSGFLAALRGLLGINM